MAESDIIKGTDLIEKGYLKDAKKEAQDLVTVIDTLTLSFSELVKIQKDGLANIKKIGGATDAKSLKATQEELNKVTEARKQAQKVEDTIAKTRAKYEKQFEQQRKKELADFKLQQKNNEAQRKASAEYIKQQAVKSKLEKQRQDELRATAILESDQLGLEAKLAAQNTLLRIERAKLTGQEADYQQRLEKINKQLDANNEKIKENSDKLKQQSLNVGNYTDSVREAIDSSELLGSEFGKMSKSGRILFAAFGQIKGQLSGIRDEFKKGKKDGSPFLATLKGIGAIGLTGLAAGFGAALSSSREFETKFQLLIAKLTNGFQAFVDATGNLFENKLFPTFELLFLKVEKFFSADFSGELSDKIDELTKKTANYKSTFDGIFDTIEASNKEVEKQILLQNELIDLTNEYSKRISLISGQLEVQNEIAGDSTRSFKELNEANAKALELTRAKAKLEVELAEKQQDAATAEVKAAFINLGLGKQINEQEIKSLEFITKSTTAKRLGVALQQKITDATINLQTKQNELAIAEIKILREERQIKQDQLEKDLDILIDGFDNQKTVNEKIIADELRVFAVRRAKLEETRKLSDIAYKEQEVTLQKFTNKKIDLDELVATSDAKALNDKIRGLGLSEIIEGRILEAVRERRLVIQDLYDAEKDLNKLEKEKNQRIKESRDNIEALRVEAELRKTIRIEENERRKQEAKDVFSDDKLQKLLQSETELKKQQALNERDIAFNLAQTTIVEEDEKLQKMLEINKKYYDDVNQIQQESYDKSKELARQEFNSRVNFANKTAQEIGTAFQSELDARNAIVAKGEQDEIKRGERNIETQRRLAESGAENTLAFEEALAAKRELASREREERVAKEKEAIQLTQAYLNALNARLTQFGANPQTAPAQALADVLLAKSIAKGLVQFAADGNNMIEGAGTTTSDSIPFMLSKKEAVIKASENIKHNDAVVDLNAGVFGQKWIPKADIGKVLESSNSTAQNIAQSIFIQQNNEIKDLLLKIADKPVQQVNVDQLGNLIETVYKDGIKKVTTHINKRRL
ncbi:MAG: hypothetical protein VKL60_20915 [Sphaerospermopsis sp.]|nr:hypothetical protein [Sphaerospermopsis sp.]